MVGWLRWKKNFNDMPGIEHVLQQKLATRSEAGLLRKLRVVPGGIDFYSNDYLGIARSGLLSAQLAGEVQRCPGLLSGSTGSRLVSGNSPLAGQVEHVIAQTHQTQAALLFASGYNANLALFSCLPQRGDTIIADERVHRSVHDGCALSFAKKWKFAHNDVSSLQARLARAGGQVFVAIESLYSMNGDFAPLQAIVEVCRKYGAALLVDEAHAFGVFGQGLVVTNGWQREVLATVVTYGKAMGLQGAAVLCSDTIKQYLVNFAAPFIYSTASPDIQWKSIQAGYHYLQTHTQLLVQLQQNIQLFRQQVKQTISHEGSPVQAVLLPRHRSWHEIEQALRAANINAFLAKSPTVSPGAECIRVCLHSFNSAAEIQCLAAILNAYFR